MRVHRLTVNPYQENTYLLVGEAAQAWVIDPGFSTEEERQRFIALLHQTGAQLQGVYLTHAHIDHILGVAWIIQTYRIPLYYSEAEEVVYKHAGEWALLMGLSYNPGPLATRYLEEGEELSWGGERVQVLHVPGHSPGHLAYYLPQQKWLFSGDVLFQGSIGNYELPLADYDTLMHTLHHKVLSLDDDVAVWPGHGEPTTIGQEKHTNPFLRRV
ncbi:MAG: MBL fold metallo-hydrolase [Bacteroidia bacterium]|nr:MBL fold metallo-hydrolase [Bacteroidia bacterium]